MLKKIDVYIIGKFISTFFFILFLLVLIAVVIDLSEKIDNFIKTDASVWMIFTKYFLNFIPQISALLGPFFVLVAVVFFTSQLASRSEIIAMTSGGISFYRLLYPYFIGALIIAVFLFYSNHYLVPTSNKEKYAFEREYLNNYKITWVNKIHRKIGKTSYIYTSNYNEKTRLANEFTVENFENGILTEKINSTKAIWNDTTETWKLYNYTKRKYINGKEHYSVGNVIDTAIAYNPGITDNPSLNREEMTTPELKNHINMMQEVGQSDVDYFKLELHRRTASIFSLMLLTIIGFSLASKKVRGGLGIHIVSAIILAGLFEIISKFSTTFTTNAGLAPFWGVWIPNLVFIFIAIVFIRFAQK